MCSVCELLLPRGLDVVKGFLVVTFYLHVQNLPLFCYNNSAENQPNDFFCVFLWFRFFFNFRNSISFWKIIWRAKDNHLELFLLLSDAFHTHLCSPRQKNLTCLSASQSLIKSRLSISLLKEGICSASLRSS